MATHASEHVLQIIQDSVIETKNVEKILREDGTKMINSFEVIKNLGKGAFGKVKLCRDTSDPDERLYAIKIMDKNVLKKKRQGLSNMLQAVQKEIAIMKKLSHPNCVRMYEVIDDPTSSKLYLRLEFVTGGQCMEAANGTQPLPLETAKKYFADMIIGLEYLHHNHILHRDIKPENLLVCKETGRLKLADFGVSQHLESDDGDDGDMITKSAGTPAFMAPECCVPGAFHGKLADIWAAGISLYFFVHGRCPFISSNVMQMYDKIREEEIEYDASLPADLVDLLKKLLAKDPADRIRIPQIKQHAWFLSHRGGEQPERVTVTQTEVRSAFTLTMKVMLLVKIQMQLKRHLTAARTTIAARSGPAHQAAEGEEEGAGPTDRLVPQQHAVPALIGAVIPEGMQELEDSDAEDDAAAAITDELAAAVEQADASGNLHLAHPDMSHRPQKQGSCSQQ